MCYELGEIAGWLKALVAFADDADLVHSKLPVTPVLVDQCPLLASTGICSCVVDIQTSRHTHKKIN